MLRRRIAPMETPSALCRVQPAGRDPVQLEYEKKLVEQLRQYETTSALHWQGANAETLTETRILLC